MGTHKTNGIRATAWAAGLLLLLVGCSEEPQQGVSTSELKARRDAIAARAPRDPNATARPSAPSASDPAEQTEFASAGTDYVYDPTNKRDPFRSFVWDRQEQTETEDARGPLEQFELEQLQVTAVIWDTGRPRALVSDPSGRSYIVHEGTKIGKNDGLVIHIGDNLVLVKETYVDFAGDQTTKDVELRIRTSQGG